MIEAWVCRASWSLISFNPAFLAASCQTRVTVLGRKGFPSCLQNTGLLSEKGKFQTMQSSFRFSLDRFKRLMTEGESAIARRLCSLFGSVQT
jgi:hypothetical protein